MGNPLWIIVPCHRVIGSDGSLTGYAGGYGAKNGYWNTKTYVTAKFVLKVFKLVGLLKQIIIYI
jgi:hypothetical protein